jgi:hypothetical protein
MARVAVSTISTRTAIATRFGLPSGLGIAAALASTGTALGNRTDHLKGLELKVLALAAQVEGDEMAQMLEGNLALELELEGHGPAAIGAGLLPHFDHQISGLWPGVNQLTPHGDIVVALGQLITGFSLLSSGFAFGGLPAGFGFGQGAGLPDPHHLEVKPFLFLGPGINHPQMGLLQVEVAAHQGKQAP